MGRKCVDVLSEGSVGRASFISFTSDLVDSGGCQGLLQKENRLPHQADGEDPASSAGEARHETR